MEVAKRVDLKCSHHEKEMVIMWHNGSLANTMEVMILKYINIPNQYVVQLKFTQCHMSTVSQ